MIVAWPRTGTLRRANIYIGQRPLAVEGLRHVCRTAKGELRIMLAFGLYLGCRLCVNNERMTGYNYAKVKGILSWKL